MTESQIGHCNSFSVPSAISCSMIYEVAFARFKMHDDKGASIVYSHRFYGKDASEKMRDWLAKNGQATEKTLIAWDKIPKLDGLK